MRVLSTATLALLVSISGASATTVEHVGFVAPDIVEVVLKTGRVEPGVQVPYVRQEGDTVRTHGENTYLYRDGRKAGVLVGEGNEVLCPFDRVEGEPLSTTLMDEVLAYTIRSTDDERYSSGKRPLAAHRKSGPAAVARVDDWRFEAAVEHRLFFVLPEPLRPDARYEISARGVAMPRIGFVCEPLQMRSEAVHVSHLGFAPDDPAKVGFLSCWMGSGGGLSYPDERTFHVVADRTDQIVHSGSVRLTKPATARDEDAYKRNFNLTDVYEMDFSDLTEPGVYRLYVEDIGCSYPFRIGQGVWTEAFVTAARGFYHMRSGIALGPPYTSYERPRPFHPDDGVKIYASTTRLMDTRNGLSRSDPDNFRNLVAGKTDEIVPDAWGAYMDAGDWDRRIQHLIASIYLLDLAEHFPERFNSLSLSIPESDNDLPDIVDEALFNLDGYRRMQTAEGGIRGGIESEEHPNLGETSWQESLTIMAYAPGSWSSFCYAGVAAKAAGVLKSLGQTNLATVYEDSAVRAMEWAEDDYAKRNRRPSSYTSNGVEIERMDNDHRVRDQRNYAAAELYRLTDDARWHRIFKETTALNEPNAQLYVWQSHQQREAAWTYVNTPEDQVDRELQENCRRAILREADDRLRTQSRTAFRWTKNDWAPPTTTLSVSDAVSIVRAHMLTGEETYRKALVLACQHGLGANPLNRCYTTGVGHRYPENPLHLDSQRTGQPAPAGLTVFGPVDPTADNDVFLRTVVAPFAYPEPKHWPTIEAYWDVFWYPVMSEFTIHHPMAANTYTWGYLAALAGR